MGLDNNKIILPHGGYQKLKSFQMSEIVYDATVKFCERFVSKFSRTTDQMIQAARSGRQNIAEGSMASGISKETEIKLVGVARASLEELLLDYQDYLRQNGLKLWNKDNSSAIEIRRLGSLPDRSYMTYRTYVEQSTPETAANTIICLIHQTNYLLDRQLRQLEEAFVKQGGLRERMYQARQKERQK
ncbi:MAG: four helix bundle protein [Candidatus Goldbacteria bacterium]|nr:four helix bundle protein [Candidatus Goldiibacteriota bacterium]